MRFLARALLAFSCLGLLAACSSGSTEVQGIDGGETGSATGPTASGPTAVTGPTAATGVTGATFGDAVSLDIPSGKNPTGAAMYSCEGLEGTWIYEPGQLPVEGIEFTLAADPVEMDGGDGTLVIEGTMAIPGAGGEVSFVDTVKLEIAGTPEAPTMTSAGVQVDVSGALEGIPIDLGTFFPENASFPIVSGASQC